MKVLLLILILVAFPAGATVEDPGGGSIMDTGGTWTVQTEPSLPSFLPSPCPDPSLCLDVSVNPVGPKADSEKIYVTQGKTLEFLVSVENWGSSEVNAGLGISSKSCPMEWFSWMEESLSIPAGSTRTRKLLVSTDTNAMAGTYDFAVDASSRCCKSNPAEGDFIIQDLDYASETAISGTGQFLLNKNVRSMDSGIKSNKEILFSGSVDALVKNEYLVDGSLGKNPNFESRDAVDNYNALSPGDSLIGNENFKSSAVFGGVGAKLQESYDLQQMEFESQSFNLHQTGSMKKTAEFKTANNFTGFYLIDAKQTIPGQKNLLEHEEYLGSFEINRKILFRNKPTSESLCFAADCAKKPGPDNSDKVPGQFVSPCSSGSCNKFTNALNAFSKSA